VERDAPDPEQVRTVLFVCQHGASRSRLAAAWFTLVAPPGWRAASAGLEPAAAVSPSANRLAAGTPAEGLLDRTRPRPLTAALVPVPTLVVAIDCALPGAACWDLAAAEPTGAMCDELAARTAALARALAPAWVVDDR
jgi:protein-tyrosine-phosphatase